MKDKMIWNTKKTASVRISKLENITITVSPDETFEVKGWFNNDESFYFGNFTFLDEAREYVEKEIHKQFEEVSE